MPRAQGDVVVTLSVLDRLIDFEPGLQVEVPPSRSQSVRTLKNAVRRDLEWLLNSRRVAQEPDENLREVNQSLYVYGLPDFTTYAISAPADQAKLVRQVLATIRLFEPRLAHVHIIPVEEPVIGIQQLRFRIEAMLLMDPAPEPVSFDTVIELKSGNCRLTGGSGAG
jgi:type VI secretion system protein ImpF